MGGDGLVARHPVDPGQGRAVREGAAKLGMIAPAVVALPVVLHDELPVALLDRLRLERDLGLGQPMGRHIGLDRGAEGREIGRHLGERDEEVAGDLLAVHGLEAEPAMVDLAAHVAREDEAAVELVGPLVVGADDLGGGSSRTAAELLAAMAADVVEGACALVAAAHDEKRIGPDLDGEVIAGTRDLAGMAGEEPLLVEDLVEIALVIGGVGVEAPRQAVIGSASEEGRQHRRARRDHRGSFPIAALKLHQGGRRRR